MRAFERVSGRLAGFENWVMIIGMGLASFLITLQVILRYFFNYSISWGEELTRYAIVWMSFVGAGMGIRKGAHICVDILMVFLSEQWKKGLTSLMAIVGAGFGMALFVTGCKLVYSGIERGQVSPALEVPIFIVYLAVPLGGLIMIFRWVELFINTFRGFFPQVEVERKGGM
jgi:C4-dicarboxylate transporter, DctQ subunit